LENASVFGTVGESAEELSLQAGKIKKDIKIEIKMIFLIYNPLSMNS